MKATVLAAWLLCMPAAASLACACQPAQGAEAERVATVAVNAASTVVIALDDLEADFDQTLDQSMPTELAAAELRVERLERAADSIRVAQDWLSGNRDADSGRAALRSAVTMLGLVVKELQADGRKVPAEVIAALAAASRL